MTLDINECSAQTPQNRKKKEIKDKSSEELKLENKIYSKE